MTLDLARVEQWKRNSSMEPVSNRAAVQNNRAMRFLASFRLRYSEVQLPFVHPEGNRCIERFHRSLMAGRAAKHDAKYLIATASGL